MYRHKLAAVALLGITACAVAACGGSSSPSAGGRTTPAVPGTPAGGPAATSSAASVASSSQCSVSPSTMVGKALGLPVGKLVPSVEGPVTVCAFAGRYEVIVRYQTGETAAIFAQTRSSQAGMRQQAVATVSGLGDDAYEARYTGGKVASNTLAARQGDMAIFITSPASIGAERALMKTLLTKV